MRHRVNTYFKLIIKKATVLKIANEIVEANTIDTKLDAFMINPLFKLLKLYYQSYLKSK